MEKVVDKINIFYGVVIAVGVTIFGTYWFLFAGFLIANVIDYATGWIKAKYFNKNESSKIGAKGVIKKVGYWVVIAIAFFVAFALVRMGELLDINLRFVVFFGWFTLGTYLINEFRSILENLIEMGVIVPNWLVDGLEVANNAINRLAKDKEME